MCMPVKDLEMVSSYWGRKQRDSRAVHWLRCSFFFFLPARFDWSIMGCTILLLALMNLAERRREKKTERRKTNVKSPCIHTQKRFITSHHKDKTVLHDLMATLATESLREALTTKQQQTKGQLCADLGTQ